MSNVKPGASGTDGDLVSSDPRTETLVLDHLPLVGYNVAEMLQRVPPSVSRDELASAGALALVLAARAYDPSTNVPFARYASLRIKGALIDELRSMDWASRGARRRGRELESAAERLRATLGRTPTREELASAMGCEVGAVDATRAESARRLLSLDLPDSTVADTVQDRGETPEQALLSGERVHWLRAAVEELPDRLRVVVSGLYLEDRSVAELAAELGVTQSRVSQLRSEALTLLRDGLNTAFDPDLVSAPERPDGVAERRRQAYFASIASRATLASLPAPHGTVPTQRAAAVDAPVRAG